MSEIQWIKIGTNIFDNEKIMFLEEMPESDALIVIWFKLLIMAGKKNDCGLIYITKDIPYNENMLVKVIKRPANIIKLALKTFEKLGMIEIVNDVIAIKNWEKHQNIEGMEKLKLKWKEASKKYREKQKEALLIVDKRHNSSYDGHNNSSYDGHNNSSYDGHNTDKIRKDKNKNKNKKEIERDNAYVTLRKNTFGELNNVLLTEEEYNRLKKDFGIKIITKYINSLSLWAKFDPKTNHNLTIRSWLNKDDIPKFNITTKANFKIKSVHKETPDYGEYNE